MNYAKILNHPQLVHLPQIHTFLTVALTIAMRQDPERKDPLWDKLAKTGGLK
jgi:hypothetical protein